MVATMNGDTRFCFGHVNRWDAPPQGGHLAARRPHLDTARLLLAFGRPQLAAGESGNVPGERTRRVPMVARMMAAKIPSAQCESERSPIAAASYRTDCFGHPRRNFRRTTS